MKMKSLVLCLAFMICIGSGFYQVQEAFAEKKMYKIGFHLWKPGKIYDEAMAGIKDALKTENISYKAETFYADKSKEKAIENFKKMDSMGLDLIYSLSSAGSKIAKNLGLKTPIIATVVNHPISLGLKFGDKNNKLTGTSYYIDTHDQLKLYLKLFPEITKVGMIYDKNNPAGYSAEEPFLKQACMHLGKEFLSIGIENKSEILETTKKIIKDGAEIIVIPTNNLVYGNLKELLEITHAQKIPVVSMNKQGVENGALAALFSDTYKTGLLTGPIAKKILIDKINPKHIPFKYSLKPDLIINMKEAKNLGYNFPHDVLSDATIKLQ